MHGDELLPPDSRPLGSQLDFFHKLGYSTAQVHAVQQKFGPVTDTDKILGELVRVGAAREQQRPVTTMCALVPSGDCPPGGAALQVPVYDQSGEGDDTLRPVVIDGSNVAMSHGNKEFFSCLGIQLAVNFFLDRGHQDVTVFVPSWRKEQPRPDAAITDQQILRDLERQKILTFTPSRRVAGKRVVCNDDWFIVKHAFESDGIVVSNDMYRDLQAEKPDWKRFIEERLLMYSFVNNKFMPPDDPLGRHGPNLENFLRKFPKTKKKQPCPYGKKCTYGVKCKFHHPERSKQSHRSVADELRDGPRTPPPQAQFSTLEEELALKLSLESESSSPKKSGHSKGSHRSGRRSSARKEKAERGPATRGGSQDRLDSGLGSIDSQTVEAGWNEPQSLYQYASTKSGPCSCYYYSYPTLHPHSTNGGPWSAPHYPGYCQPALSRSADFHHSRASSQQHSRRSHKKPTSRSPQAHGADRPPHSTPSTGEREVVRKKLLAIFSATVVDAAMEMSPEVLDPQLLVAKILLLQSQNHSLR